MVTGDFVHGMEVALQQAGACARLLRGRVLNERKVVATDLPCDDAALRERRSAKSVTDEVVQEVLLLAAAKLLPTETVHLDAEEQSPSVRYFGLGPGDLSLVVDPIDGTLEYLSHGDNYSVCMSLIKAGRMQAAMVYFPERDDCFALDETGRSFLARSFSAHGFKSATRLSTKAHEGRRIYCNGRVEEPVLLALRAAGFEVVDDSVGDKGAPDCILSCFSGEAMGYLAHTRQVRDILLGAVVEGAQGGMAVDWQGEPLVWPAGGRLPRAAFLGTPPSGDLLECLHQASPQ